MSTERLFADGTEVKVAKRIAKGGEGEVFFLDNMPEFVLKAYLPHLQASREGKVRAMVDARLFDLMSTAAFPVKIATNSNGGFVGFLMRLVPDHKEAHELTTPSSRQKHFPSADYRFLVRTAINVARVFGQIHAAGCVVGDINQRSIMVSQKATVALIDTDSFQFIRNGQQHLCVVGVPEYTPPELQGKSLSSVVRTQDHDAFGLAVAIFQILCMDRHPFSGRFKGGGDKSIEDAIKEFRFAYSGRPTQMEPPPATVQLADLSPWVIQNFEQAFSPQGVGKRPTAAQWVTALEELEGSLRPCSVNKAHHYSRFAPSCPWCRMEEKYGVPMFVNRDYASVHIPKGMITDGTGYTINVGAIQAVLNSLVLPTQISIKVPQSKLQLAASSAATAHKDSLNTFGIVRFVAALAALGAVACFLLVKEVPKIASAFVGIVAGFFFLRSEPGTESFTNAYRVIAEKIKVRVQHLQSTAPVAKAEDTKREINAKLAEYAALVENFRNVEREYNGTRRQQQLDAHLSSYTIRGARIAKLKSGDVASLASFGFATAYDAKHRDVEEVYGIGPVKAASIASWVRVVEGRFQYQTAYTDADRQAIQRKRDNIVSRQQGCADSLNQLVERFKQEAKAFTDWSGDKDRELLGLVDELAQAEADLNYLGLRVPGVSPIPPSTPINPNRVFTTVGSGYAATRTTGSQSPTSGTPSCPNCGSRMVRRMATRGSRTGRPFWGCSRYPTCKGTRNT